MSTSYYVSPEQLMQDRSEFVQKGIDKAKEVIVLEYNDGLVMVAENPLTTVFKISEIYDRIGLAATGLYREYEALRFVGIRDSEIKGLTYTRGDVTAKWLTNLYSQYIGGSFWQFEAKPLEVELLVCELGEDRSKENRIYHISFDGTFWEDEKFAVVGGRSDEIIEILSEKYSENLELENAIKLAVDTFSTIEAENSDGNGEEEIYEVDANTIEVAILDTSRKDRRKFQRLSTEKLNELLR